MKKAKSLKEAANGTRQKPKIKVSDLLGSGSTMLNIACSNHHKGAFPKGTYTLIVGDSNSGKSWIAHNIFAEAAHDSRFDDYEFVYDDAEGGALMNVENYFGKKTAERITPPFSDGSSATIEDFYDAVHERLDSGNPFIYFMDSMDVLTSESEQKKNKQQRNARGQDKEAAGSMTDAKAKYNSQHLREVVNRLKSTGSLLFIISQTRDNMGFGAKFNPKTRAGGNALRFYATIELWLARRQRIKKTVRGKPRTIGIETTAKVERSRITGRNLSVSFPIMYSHGIDDVASCIDFLVDEKHWKDRKGIITASDFEFTGSREKLIQHIESEELEWELRDLVSEIWREIEKLSAVKRKKRYS